jgi:hypothetical protein
VASRTVVAHPTPAARTNSGSITTASGTSPRPLKRLARPVATPSALSEPASVASVASPSARR